MGITTEIVEITPELALEGYRKHEGWNHADA